MSGSLNWVKNSATCEYLLFSATNRWFAKVFRGLIPRESYLGIAKKVWLGEVTKGLVYRLGRIRCDAFGFEYCQMKSKFNSKVWV